MTTELERHRDYMREMAGGAHSQECEVKCAEDKSRWSHFRLFREWPEAWGERPSGPPKPCDGGCVTEADRALWKRLANEIDDYLSDDDEPLWADQ